MIAVAMLCIFAQPTLANSTISVEPAYIDVWQDDEFTVDIVVYPVENEVYSASYTLYFNNTLLNATSQTQGAFLIQDGNSSNVWICDDGIDNTIGKIEYAESRVGTDVGVTNPGVLATIAFRVIGVKGISSLDISELAGGLLESTSGPIPTDISNGTCAIEYILEQTPRPTTPPTTTATATPVQTPTTLPITPTPTVTVTQTPTIFSTPPSSPTIITSPISPTSPTSPPKGKSEENNRLSGFRAAFAITGLLAVFILKEKNVRK
jgi:hypothetical protein